MTTNGPYEQWSSEQRQPAIKLGPNSPYVQYYIVRSIQQRSGNFQANHQSMDGTSKKGPPCITTISLKTTRNLTKTYYPDH